MKGHRIGNQVAWHEALVSEGPPLNRAARRREAALQRRKARVDARIRQLEASRDEEVPYEPMYPDGVPCVLDSVWRPVCGLEMDANDLQEALQENVDAAARRTL